MGGRSVYRYYSHDIDYSRVFVKFSKTQPFKGFMMRHRNTRRRPYRPFGYYCITTNVNEGYQILDKATFGFLAEHMIHLSAELHDVKIIAYKINPDHVHILCHIGQHGTISEYMSSWKRQFSRQTNKILADLNPGWDSNPNLEKPQHMHFKKFKWQSSYYSHMITSRKDYFAHVNYILNEHKHHDLPENKFLFWNKDHVFLFE